jgi:hypothetical protein
VNPARPRQRLLACSLLCAGLIACGGVSGLKPDAPAGVNLAGTWKLDRALSDDPEKIYDKIRRQRAERYADQAPAPPPRGGGPGSSGGRGPDSGGVNPDGTSADPNNPLSAEAQAAAIIGTSHLDPFDMGVFGTIPRGDVITIRQRPDEMYIFDGTTDRSFTPGTKSVVSVPEGVADQHSGWKSRAYVIDVRAQAGPETIETYHLSDDGQHLLADIQSHGGNMPSIKIKRVYDRMGAAANVAPTND